MLKVLKATESAEWDSVVKSFSDYDVYYLNRYALPFALHGDGAPHLFYYEGDGIRAVNVVMWRDIADDERFAGKIGKNEYFDFVTPYGYGGWLIEGDSDTRELFREYESFCVDNGIVSEFLRLHPMLNNHKRLGDAYTVLHVGETISMELTSADAVWNNMTSKKRNMIRKAEKNGVVIEAGNEDSLYETFRKIYNETMDRDNVSSYYYFEPEFYAALKNGLPDNSVVFYAKNAQGEIIAASIILYCNGKLTYHLSGAKTEFRSLAPTDLLLCKAALWGLENGCKTFHLGGGVGAKQDNLFHFKKAFYKGEPQCYYIGKKIFDAQKYDKLLALRGETTDTGFFPQYRA